ncbi:hypothetical protein AJ87_22830 [Rhizobium yanglingense]|nr:hypothetical protein AJ87_22830 [Rhizobium yanglingense]
MPSGCSATICASKARPTCGWLSIETIMSPRATSTCRSSTRVIASPATAALRTRSKVTILETLATMPDGRIMTLSPGFTEPPATVP